MSDEGAPQMHFLPRFDESDARVLGQEEPRSFYDSDNSLATPLDAELGLYRCERHSRTRCTQSGERRRTRSAALDGRGAHRTEHSAGLSTADGYDESFYLVKRWHDICGSEQGDYLVALCFFSRPINPIRHTRIQWPLHGTQLPQKGSFFSHAPGTS